MAFTIEYIYQAVDKFSSKADKIARSMGKVGRAADNNKKILNALSRSTKDATAVISGRLNALAATAAGFFGARAFLETGSRFQDALLDLSSITGATGQDLQFLSDQSLSLAKASKTAQDEVATAFKTIASAKSELLEDPKGLSEVTKQVLLLKNAAGISLADAAETALESLNQFSAGADQAGRFVNILAAGSKIGASEVAQTGQAVLGSGTAANAAGVSFEELNTLIQVLAKNGIKGAEAGTALRNVLLILETSGSKKLQPSIVGITESLDLLSKANLNAAQVQELFKLENFAAAQILLKNVDLIRKWKVALTGTNIAQEQADIRLSGFNAKARGLGIAINDIVIRTFLRLEPVLSKQVESFGQFLDTIDADQVDRFADSIASLAENLDLLGAAIRFPASILKGLGINIGEFFGAVATGNFDRSLGTSATEAFSIGGRLLGVGEPQKVQIDVNLNDPGKNVDSVSGRTKGGGVSLNTGVNTP